MKSFMLRVVLILILATCFTVSGLLARDLFFPERGVADEPQVAPAPIGGGADALPRRAAVILVAPQGAIDLRDAPASAIVRFTVAAGTRARVGDFVVLEGKTWYLVELVDGGGQGWVPAETVRAEDASLLRFADFQFCLGNVRGPVVPCGDMLPLSEEGLWLRWRYSGLNDGDMVQRLLLINGQQVASAPQRWTAASSGAQLVNLLADGPRVEGGLWTVRFLVNGELAAEMSVHIEAAQ